MSNITQLFQEKRVPVQVLRVDRLPHSLVEQIVSQAIYIAALYGQGLLEREENALTTEGEGALAMLQQMEAEASQYAVTEERILKEPNLIRSGR